MSARREPFAIEVEEGVAPGVEAQEGVVAEIEGVGGASRALKRVDGTRSSIRRSWIRDQAGARRKQSTEYGEPSGHVPRRKKRDGNH